MSFYSASENPFKGIFTSLTKPGGGEFGKYYSLPDLNDPRIGMYYDSLNSTRCWLTTHFKSGIASHCALKIFIGFLLLLLAHLNIIFLFEETLFNLFSSLWKTSSLLRFGR